MAFDWNDLKAFLAVARGGSTLAAAKALAVNQTTVARRIESLEAALGLKLFERGQAGSRLTEAGRDLVAEAEKVERAAAAFDNRARAHGRGLAGAIKITCSEILANAAITPALGHFRRQHPEVQIELVITDAVLDIAAGEADVAVRSGRLLEPSDLIARKLATYQFAHYCSRGYAAQRGVPATPAELRDHDLIASEGSMGPLPGVDWMFAQAGGKAPAHISNSMTNLLHAVRAGLGVAPLSCLLADGMADLVRCSEIIAEAESASWLVTRREARDIPRIRAFLDFLVPHVQAELRAREAKNRLVQQRAAAEAGEALDGALI
jgi:DNA-binding transcriptional LysR family regulator